MAEERNAVDSSTAVEVTSDVATIENLAEQARHEGFTLRQPAPRMRGGPDLATLLVSLGSAGTFSAFVTFLSKFLDRNKQREVTIVRGKNRITVKAHSLREEQQLLAPLFPEYDARPSST